MSRSTEVRHTHDPFAWPAGEGSLNCSCYYDEEGNLYRDRNCPFHGW